ncbi:hypothetical protein AVEN_238749-1 [Araneus ventricosus]|uniref:Uncharacterized protein n=1 Tax=Araneus ventricosus TaxID=182803 RepID=A0A4Y2RN92_ARAVE|nr:hypothetical protein AVEN_238749-1 [Araneus ventricosus]
MPHSQMGSRGWDELCKQGGCIGLLVTSRPLYPIKASLRDTTSMWMRSCRISERFLAFSGGTIMVGVWLPPPVVVLNSFAKGRAVAEDGY